VSTGTKGRLEVARGELSLGSRRVAYRIVRSSRARQVRLRSLHDGVIEVVVPPRIRLPSIEDILRSKQRWIEGQLGRADALPSIQWNRIDYLGNEYAVTVQRHPGRTGRIFMEHQDIFLKAPAGVPVVPIIESFLRQQARAILHERANVWADVMQVQYRRLSVRDQRTRWGSCSATGGLNFSWRLIMAPLPVLEYVVIHELMHLRELNHSTRFWDGVATYCPEYRQHRAWLKDNGPRLARAPCVDESLST
jgi:predicted metal-dependent hydrolase